MVVQIGANIRSLREKRGLKQIELAEIAGISNTFLSDIENERVNPSIKTLSKLAGALGINIDWDIFLSSNYVQNEILCNGLNHKGGVHNDRTEKNRADETAGKAGC